MGLSQCRPGRDRSVHPACRVRVCKVRLRPSSAPGIAIDSRSFRKELLGPEVRNGFIFDRGREGGTSVAANAPHRRRSSQRSTQAASVHGDLLQPSQR
jgi:hypothetical protein